MPSRTWARLGAAHQNSQLRFDFSRTESTRAGSVKTADKVLISAENANQCVQFLVTFYTIYKVLWSCFCVQYELKRLLQLGASLTSVSLSRASRASRGPWVLSMAFSLSWTSCIQVRAAPRQSENSCCSCWVMTGPEPAADWGHGQRLRYFRRLWTSQGSSVIKQYRNLQSENAAFFFFFFFLLLVKNKNLKWFSAVFTDVIKKCSEFHVRPSKWSRNSVFPQKLLNREVKLQRNKVGGAKLFFYFFFFPSRRETNVELFLPEWLTLPTAAFILPVLPPALQDFCSSLRLKMFPSGWAQILFLLLLVQM